MPAERSIYCGSFVHCLAPNELDICTTAVIGVDEHGKIAFVERDTTDGSAAAKKHGWTDPKVVNADQSSFFFPGFIDTHIHASQYPNAGIFGKSTLLDWLATYTFPLEASFASLDRAAHVYRRLVSRTLAHGTTTAAYYATIHVPATNLLADICLERGQRALVGRVCMDAMGPAGTYRDESAAEGLRATRECAEHIRAIDPAHALVTPVLTPRFAPACSAECLAGLGAMARETGYPIQTHISENTDEIALVARLFPERASYADVYDHAGLLTDRTILAHAVHLTEEELRLVAARGAKVSHCPSSNTALTSGCARVRGLMERGIDVGLGTDVSGGFSASVLEVARHSIWVSRYIAMAEGEATKLSVEDALYLATKGGAKVVGLQGKVGWFDVGMEWDAQLVVLNPVEEMAERHGEHEPPVDVFGWEIMEDRIHKWVYGGDDRNTAAVWVMGRLVHSTSRFKS